jgi:hypothetical protein
VSGFTEMVTRAERLLIEANTQIHHLNNELTKVTLERDALRRPLPQHAEDGMRIRHAAVEQAADKLSAAHDMAYLSHLDRGELLVEIARLRVDVERLTRKHDPKTLPVEEQS